ncbi:MAG: ATP-dependent DNA helicase RecG [Gammaproteobacteria bacterium]|nr:ATP-dependent DNA helicase RecG [Gammaproteobacteria bacterium]
MNAGPALVDPITRLKGVGPKLAERLDSLGVRRVLDLLFHLPHRYQDRTRVVPLSSARPGTEARICGVVSSAEIRLGRRRSLLVHLSDGSGAITLRFFHFSEGMRQKFRNGARLACFGEVRRGPSSLEMVHPECTFPGRDGLLTVDEHLTPIYPLTEGVGQATLRNLVDDALAIARQAGQVPELVPPSICQADDLMPLLKALEIVHRPPPSIPVEHLNERAHPAQKRLAFEELLAQQLTMQRSRQRIQRLAAPPVDTPNADGLSDLERHFLAGLPFELTAAQQRVCEAIRADLRQPVPMQRLVQGDVGSGKTVVAALSALRTVEAGYQVAFMAPTELLAEQHLQAFMRWLEPLEIKVEWLSGSLKSRARRSALENIVTGYARICVGTHALFQEAVEFRELGLVIIDEQHRFGVGQRLALRNKGQDHDRYPHQLVMTATPIPRTLAMTAYADMHKSIIDELPPGRQPIVTAVTSDARRAEVIERIRLACEAGQQAYWVCTLVEESDKLEAQAAIAAHEQLVDALPGLAVGLVHGRMLPYEKDLVMAEFKAGRLHLLVATTVIEVGVDVPNASLIIIENAERLGLSQLHQLRGRVGRGDKPSVCLLMYKPPLSEQSRARLDIMRSTTDGFEIAERDLALRGPGELLGTRQTGLTQLKVADLVRDAALLPAVNAAASRVMQDAPDCVEALIERWIGPAEVFVNA